MSSRIFAHVTLVALIVFTSVIATFGQTQTQYDKGTPPQHTTGVSSFSSYSSTELGNVVSLKDEGGGSGGAVATSPAATTGVGAVVPAAGVGVAVVGVGAIVHGVAVGANTINNIFSQNNNNGQSNNNGHPDKDNTVQGAQDQIEDISANQANQRNVGQGNAINSVEKSKQKAKTSLKRIRNLQDALDDDP